MNKKIVISTVMVVSLLAGGSAFAQRYDHDNDRGHNAHGQRDGRDRDRGHDSRRDSRDFRDNQSRMHDNGRHHGRHHGRGAGPRHDFYKGGRIPGEYRHRQYVVNDWRGHHLHSPPRGYQWVQTGSDYVLIAVATGIIAQIVLGN